jgi:hypothetical protein
MLSTDKDEQELAIFQRILRKIFGHIQESDYWRRMYNEELYTAYGECVIMKWIKSVRPRWAWHIACTKESDPAKKNNIRVERPKKRWIQEGQKDLKGIVVWAWRRTDGGRLSKRPRPNQAVAPRRKIKMQFTY